MFKTVTGGLTLLGLLAVHCGCGSSVVPTDAVGGTAVGGTAAGGTAAGGTAVEKAVVGDSSGATIAGFESNAAFGGDSGGTAVQTEPPRGRFSLTERPEAENLGNQDFAPGEFPPGAVQPGAVPPGVSVPRGGLRQGLTVEQLIEFLAGADEDLRMLVSSAAGQTGRRSVADEQSLLEELKRIVQLKREASQRLSTSPAATAQQMAIGKRGMLQSLSHLASLGDLSAAEELQSLADALRDDSDLGLRADSQLVLIGLTLEQLRFGKPGAADKVVSQIDSFFDSIAQADVPALMVMGQSIDALSQYGHEQQADRVRRLIAEHFGNTADPVISQMAASIAGPLDRDGPDDADRATAVIDNLRVRYFNTEPDDPTADREVQVSAADLEEWRASLAALASPPVALRTVRMLAQYGLEAESTGQVAMSNAVNSVLESIVVQPGEVGREAATAVKAKGNRASVIGQRLDPDLPSITGQPLEMKMFRGKVVLMPFWSVEFPQSLDVIADCRRIAALYGDRVAIVGMNLDVRGADVSGFATSANLDFPSYRSVSDPSSSIVNEVAHRFGAVTLTYVVLIDGEGRVASVHFSARNLERRVDALVERLNLQAQQ